MKSKFFWNALVRLCFCSRIDPDAVSALIDKAHASGAWKFGPYELVGPEETKFHQVLHHGLQAELVLMLHYGLLLRCAFEDDPVFRHMYSDMEEDRIHEIKVKQVDTSEGEDVQQPVETIDVVMDASKKAFRRSFTLVSTAGLFLAAIPIFFYLSVQAIVLVPFKALFVDLPEQVTVRKQQSQKGDSKAWLNFSL